MGAKRLRNEEEREMNQLAEKKRQNVIREILNTQKVVPSAEDVKLLAFVADVVRRVVQEEVERVVQIFLSIPRSLPEQVRAAQTTVNNTAVSAILKFEKPLSSSVFTNCKLEDEEGNPPRIILVNAENGEIISPSPSSPIKVELVVVDGAFPGTNENWTSKDFDKNIVKERTGKRPLITGVVNVTLNGGSSTVGELSFTDNSSWTRSRHFRIGAKVAGGSHCGMRIREAVTEAFIVKDHRGEAYKKHYPPFPGDQVWRLKKIRKDGPYHKRLQDASICTVSDFLILHFNNPGNLRAILGNISEKTWESMVAHAQTCKLSVNSFPRTAHMRQIVQGETYEVFGRATIPHHGAMMPQFSYLGCTIFPPCHEPLIDSAYHGSEFDGEMVSGSQLASNWENDPPSDQDSEIFFDGA